MTLCVKGGIPGTAVRLNLVNLNKQSKMYSQGMTPVYKVDLGKSEKPNAKFSKASWSRIKEIPTYQVPIIHFMYSLRSRLICFSNCLQYEYYVIKKCDIYILKYSQKLLTYIIF